MNSPYMPRDTPLPPLTGSVDHCQGSARNTLSAVLTLTAVVEVFAVSVLTLTGLSTLSGRALFPVSVRHADLSGCAAADRVKKALPPLTGFVDHCQGSARNTISPQVIVLPHDKRYIAPLSGTCIAARNTRQFAIAAVPTLSAATQPDRSGAAGLTGSIRNGTTINTSVAEHQKAKQTVKQRIYI
jgi:hypothetical protein